MHDLKFNCPHCEQSLEIPEEMLGQTVECLSCNGSIELPKPDPQPEPDIVSLIDERDVIEKMLKCLGLW